MEEGSEGGGREGGREEGWSIDEEGMQWGGVSGRGKDQLTLPIPLPGSSHGTWRWVFLPLEHTALTGASLSLSWRVLSLLLACLTILAEQKACFALRKSSNYKLFDKWSCWNLPADCQPHRIINLHQIVCHMDFQPVRWHLENFLMTTHFKRETRVFHWIMHKSQYLYGHLTVVVTVDLPLELLRVFFSPLYFL